jgi:subtilisin family serine protease
VTTLKQYSALNFIQSKTTGIHLDCLTDIYFRAQWADKFFDRLQLQVHRIVAQSQTDDNRAIIAILDTGINAQHPEMEQYIKNGIIIHSQGFPSTLDPFADKEGHGTHGTSVLHKTAPHAALLIARVADDNRGIPDIDNYAEVAKVTNPVSQF